MKHRIIAAHLTLVVGRLTLAVDECRCLMTRRMFFFALNLIVVGLLMAGCGNAGTPVPTATTVPSVTPSIPPSSTPSHTAIPLRTVIPTRTTPQVQPALDPSPTPTIIGDSSGKIAYTACSGSDFSSCEIYVMNTDGSNPIRLTKDTRWDHSPAWSPDGTKIAFVSDRDGNFEIYVMNADGSNLIRLTNNSRVDVEPTWSPDGKRIAFDSNRDGSAEIYVMNADGSDPIRLTQTGDNYNPAWSPDGTRIVFQAIRGHGLSDEIYVMNADGSNPIQLTTNEWQDLDPAWSPDSMKIAFSASPKQDGNWDIYVMNADGGPPIRLTVSGLSGADNMCPAWSPDGTKIAFCSDRDGAVEIYVMNADGTGLTRLTQNDGTTSTSPAWLHITQQPVIQLPDCTSGWTRLTAGSQAKVSEESTTPNRVRSEPSKVGDVIALLYPGSVVKVLEGQVCADGVVFWKVESDLIPGGVGWTAEGDSTEYYLVPYQT